ncbi:hypothetical protein [Nonomuraea sp. NPDC049400]
MTFDTVEADRPPDGQVVEAELGGGGAAMVTAALESARTGTRVAITP